MKHERFFEIIRYIEVKKGRSIPLGRCTNTKALAACIQIYIQDGENSKNVSGSLDEFMNMQGKIDALPHIIKLINDAENAIRLHKAVCKKCIEVGGGCEKIKTDKMAYLTCE